jgi:PPP family 3-phenylpropionic acid transporter
MNDARAVCPTAMFRLSALYFAYFAIVGAYMPFWGLYLDDRGLDGVQIGVVLSLAAVSRMLVPNLWGWLADRTGLHTRVMQAGACASTLCIAFLLPEPGYGALLVVVALYSIFWNSILPQLEVVAMSTLSGDTRAYNRARVWGSVSFIVAVVGVGGLFDVIAVDWLPTIVLALMVAFCLVASGAPAVVRTGNPAAISRLLAVVANPQVRVFLLASLLGQVALGSFYSFFSLRVEGLGFSRTTIGLLWAIGVVAEIVLFMMMHRIMARIGIRGLMLIAFGTGVLRWCIFAFVPGVLPLLVIAQLGHATTFGILHSVSIAFIHRHFPAEVAGQGQALYSAVCYGAGGAIGNLLSGWLWDHGGPGSPFVMAAIASALAFLLVVTRLDPSVRES